MKTRLRRRPSSPLLLALSVSGILLLFRPPPVALSQGCDPCTSETAPTIFKIKTGTGCTEYVQCVDGQNIGDFTCAGDTIYDEERQYCNWPSSTTCIDNGEAACPPTKAPATEQPTVSAAECTNPCPPGFTGLRARPGTRCKLYVSCDGGKVVEEMECNGDTIFNENARYCDWTSSYECEAVECPEREPTISPTLAPVVLITTTTTTVAAATATGGGSNGLFDQSSSSPPPVPDLSDESSDCPNPCPPGFTGFQTRPGSYCKKYVSCDLGEVAVEMECFGDTIFNPNVGYCDWPSSTWSCGKSPCPERKPTGSPTSEKEEEESTSSPMASNATAPSPISETSTSPPSVGPTTKSPTLPPVAEFSIDVPGARPVVNAPVPTDFSSPRPALPPTTAPPTSPPTPRPTTPRPTPMPSSAYHSLQSHLEEKEDEIASVVLIGGNGAASAAYKFEDFLTGLYVAVFQMPQDKAFFVGEGMEGRLPKLSGMEYGLANIAAFLSNAMEAGIKIDSCDEWNTDFIFEDMTNKYPLSNGCGQYGRSYQDEMCLDDEPFQCAVDPTLEITAVDGNRDNNVPPFMCKAKTFDGSREIFPGYYDSVDGVVVPSAYANTLGRTDVEGCCWWGRGVLLTRGPCAVGKLDKYVGQGAVERGVFVYPDINFCTNPEAVCNHERSNELRWVLGFSEWSDRVQSYVDEESGWSYIDELKKFVDEGMVDDSFIGAVINIVTRKCHDDSCADQWYLDEDNDINDSKRRDNFRRILFEVFGLPLTYSPTENPTVDPTYSPTFSPSMTQQPTDSPLNPTGMPTLKPTRRNKKDKEKVIGLPSNSSKSQITCDRLAFYTLVFISSILLWI